MTLLYASSRGYIEDVRRLVNSQTVKEQDDMGNTPLHLAAAAGHLDVCMALLREPSCSLNTQNNLGKTPLHEACWRSHEIIVKLLLERGAKPDIEDKSGRVPYDLARNKDIRALLPAPDDDDLFGDLSGSDSD
eukprot:CAMPEP_0174261866 /NCGR_PEP_ID=MMETSP0439-20130205/12532_1 /TAXON_ID=0 /ORGANISM="Stereomyxa ramosa, Strain Chinc5" /LENGTH=132 /DNA_ID=CAMNT_0015346465 /DNA_START=59 /DNA_END=457 /DNA_ORIENTATION=+